MATAKAATFRTVSASYQSDGVIGEGGGGTVYAAADDERRPVAIKVLEPTRATRARLKRFKNEYLFGMQNQHPHLVRVVDYGLAELRGVEAPFFVMPRYKGSLRDMMKGGLPSDQALAVFSRILLGIEAAHLKNVIHRDLKPENILANDQNDIVIADFGIARFSEEELYTAVETRDNERLANFKYAAPEQREKGSAVDARSDIFALGLMLNELFTGAVPHGEGYRTVRREAPSYAWVDEVVVRLIQAQPIARPESIAAVRELLRTQSNLFEDQQKLSALSGSVVPAGEPDDLSAIAVPRVISAVYGNDSLTITLDQHVSAGWIEALLQPSNRTSLMRAEPERFVFRGNTARIGFPGLDERSAQSIVDYFKEWLGPATSRYRDKIRRDRDREEAKRLAALKHQRAEMERTVRINSALRI